MLNERGSEVCVKIDIEYTDKERAAGSEIHDHPERENGLDELWEREPSEKEEE